MERFHQVMVSQFRDIEPMFEIEVSILIYPIFLVGLWEPRFSGFIFPSGDVMWSV